ncbi:hypothetical protein BROC_01299 [Candidatus Brocadiaceae bacterium]|nr:hypothetical protein BROC_01299 [Candidatus Brocadiaceae bacterium]
MQYLYNAVLWIIGLLAEWLVKAMPAILAQYSMLLAYMASIVALAVGFFVFIKSLIGMLDLVFPSEYLDLVGPFVPSNLSACFSIILSARTVRAALQYQKEYRSNLRLLTKVSRAK